jgi:hypothetical protein
MKVSVVRLRKDGEKVARDQLEQPVVGWLRVERWWLKNQFEDRHVRTANLLGGPNHGAMPILPALNDCELTRVDAAGFLLTGREPSEHLQQQGHRQTWWCTPVTDPPPNLTTRASR